MTARFIVADVFDGLATIEDGSVDLVVTSPPFLALRSYLPADHPDKPKEIGTEATPAEFIDTLLAVTAELRRVLAPHGSICVELGDTYAGSGGAGGDYGENGLREGQLKFSGSAAKRDAEAWPLAKSKTLVPELYRIALAYGINPLTGAESPAGRWRIRNVVTWARPNPPVGALGDKWRPATSDIVIACTSDKRYWDDLATRRPVDPQTPRNTNGPKSANSDRSEVLVGFDVRTDSNPAGAPLLDYWVIPPGGYSGSHYAVFPPELVVPLVKAMCPGKVCRVCGEPSRRVVGDTVYVEARNGAPTDDLHFRTAPRKADKVNQWGNPPSGGIVKQQATLGWTDCGHDDYRPGIVLDPFAGSGTTLQVATGHGLDAIGIDLDERNAELALERVGPFLLEVSR